MDRKLVLWRVEVSGEKHQISRCEYILWVESIGIGKHLKKASWGVLAASKFEYIEGMKMLKCKQNRYGKNGKEEKEH